MFTKHTDGKQHFSLRKLSVGVASVLLGTTFYLSNNEAVHADTVNNSNNSNTIETNNNTVNEDKWDNSQEMADNVQTQTVMVDPIVPQQTKMQTTNNRDNTAPTNSAPSQYQASAIQTNNTTANGDFDQATWGTLDASKWTGKIVSNTDTDGVTRQYYELTGYTGDLNHIIVPNEADLEAAGIDTGGHQVGINADTTHSWFEKGDPKTIAFSKTDNKMVKALESDWTSAFTGAFDRNGYRNWKSAHNLAKFDGTSLTVSNVTNLSYMFSDNQISDLTSLTNWKTDQVTDMDNMFSQNLISDLTPLANWKTDKVTDMSSMFYGNRISDLTSLTSWKTDKVTNMSSIFAYNRISNLAPLTNWKTNNTTDMGNMFGGNQISDLTPLTSWKTDNVIKMGWMFERNQISDLTPLANWKTDQVTDMDNMFSQNKISDLTSLANWKTDNVTDMGNMFESNQISNLTPLANWKTDKVTNMSWMFYNNQISDLRPLANWKTDKVTNMGYMFSDNQISNLTPLANWKTDKVTNMNHMFSYNQMSNLTPLANWKTDKVTDMSYMFDNNQISDLTPLTSWKTDKVIDMNHMFAYNQISDLTPLANWKIDKVTYMSSMFDRNQIKLADFRKWNLNQFADVSNLISNGENAIILVNSANKKLLSTDNVIRTIPNSISINSDPIDMPTLYAIDDMTIPAEKLAEKLVKQIRAQKLADYQKAHPTAKISLITPDPTNHSYDAPAIMANQEYHAVEPVTVTYQYIDDDNNQVIVSTANTIKALPDTTQALTFTLPKNYQLAKNQTLPTSIVMPDYNQTIQIHLIHQLIVVDYFHPQIPDTAIDPNDPNSPKYPDGVSKNQLIHNISRTINYVKANGTIAHKATKDYASFYRRLYIDKITGKITNSLWINSQASFPTITVPKLAGYTPDRDIISDSSITLDHADIIETVTYTPNDQTLTVNYIDFAGNVISHDDQIHKTDEDVTVTPIAPTNYKLLMSDPFTIHIQPQGNVIDIPVAPQLIFRSHTNPANTDLTHTVTRAIIIKTPNHQIHTVIQSVVFYRDDYENIVTRDHNYTPWLSNNNTFKAYIPALISSYTPGLVDSQTVSATDPDRQIIVSYTPTNTPTYPVYIDVNGIGHDTIPTGYSIVAGQDSEKGSLLIVKQPASVITPIEFVTRTITVIMPDHESRTIKQTACKGTKFPPVHLPHLKGFTTKIIKGSTYGTTNADNNMDVTVEIVKAPLTES